MRSEHMTFRFCVSLTKMKKVSPTKKCKTLKMQNFMFKCSKLALNLKKNNYLMIKTAKKDFDNFSIEKVCVLQYNYNGCFQNLFESTA